MKSHFQLQYEANLGLIFMDQRWPLSWRYLVLCCDLLVLVKRSMFEDQCHTDPVGKGIVLID